MIRAGGTTHRKVTADPCVLRAVTNNVSLAMFSTERTGHAVSASPESGSSPFRDHELRNYRALGKSQDRADLRRWFIGAGQRGVKPAVRSGNSRRVEQLGVSADALGAAIRRASSCSSFSSFRAPFVAPHAGRGVTADCAPRPSAARFPRNPCIKRYGSQVGVRYYVARLLAVVMFAIWNRMQVQGLENVPRTGPVLLAGNHLSFIDNVVIPVAVPRRVRFLAKSDYFTGKGLQGAWYRFFFSSVGAVPLPRGTHSDAQAALDIARGLLEKGEAFGIYPEGTRSRDGRLYRGRTGVAWLALKTGAVIVPVGLKGTQKAQPIGARALSRKISVTFGEPVRVSDVAHLSAPAQQRRALTDLVMDRIAALTGQEETGVYNTPPPADS